jgi:hypothetical protein
LKKWSANAVGGGPTQKGITLAVKHLVIVIDHFMTQDYQRKLASTCHK